LKVASAVHNSHRKIWGGGAIEDPLPFMKSSSLPLAISTSPGVQAHLAETKPHWIPEPQSQQQGSGPQAKEALSSPDSESILLSLKRRHSLRWLVQALLASLLNRVLTLYPEKAPWLHHITPEICS
jgi:hypothetical protein